MDKDKNEYQGNTIPLVIKILWAMLVVWIFYYLIKYMIPDLREWMNK